MENNEQPKRKRGNPNWIKGRSPNPNGRPKGKSMVSILREESEAMIVRDGELKINARIAIARRLLQLAVQGDMQAIKYCYDRLEGSPVQSTMQVDEQGNSVNPVINVVFKE